MENRGFIKTEKDSHATVTNEDHVDNFLFIYLFAIFILHLRESELYRYILDGRSALTWELTFRCLGHLSST